MDDKHESGVHPLFKNVPKSLRVAVFLAGVGLFIGWCIFLAHQLLLLPEQLALQMLEWGDYVAPRIACLFDFDATHRIYEFVYQQPYPTGLRLQDALQTAPYLSVWGVGMSLTLLWMAWRVIGSLLNENSKRTPMVRD